MIYVGYLLFVAACILAWLAVLILLPVYIVFGWAISATRLPEPAQKFLRGVIIGAVGGTLYFFAALGAHEWFGCSGTWLVILGCMLIAIGAPYSKNLWGTCFVFVTFVVLVFTVL